ncbi:MAG: response regulator transcription factor [Bryobacter sp.]|nr:response regulator transcription factor [Bryobacter sp.]
METRREFEIVCEASNGREALRGCLDLQPDVAILDIAMPQLNGIEVATQACRGNHKLKIVFLTMHADETYLVRALRAGAQAYLLKESAADDLLPAMNAVLAGKCFFSPAISNALLADPVQKMRDWKVTDSLDLLSRRELEVLQLLAEGHTNKEIATLLNVSVSTIDTHRLHIMQKLNLRHFADLVLYAFRKGILSNAG